jgi:anti-sigma B factor antagonist
VLLMAGCRQLADLLTVSVSALGACVVLALVGEWTANASGRVREVLALLVGAGVRRVVVDLSGLWFMAPDGLAVLLEAQATLAKRGRSLVVASPQKVVARALNLMGASERLEVFPSVAEAAAG